LQHGKRGVASIVGLICFILTATAAILAEPTPKAEQSEQGKIVHPLPDPEEAPGVVEQGEESKSEKDVSARPQDSDVAVPPGGKELSASELSLILNPIFESSRVARDGAGKAEPSKLSLAKGKAPKRGLVSRIVAVGKRLVSRAMSWKGVRYVWGGSSKRGVDCSGLTQLIFAKEGIWLPHSASVQFKMGRPISRKGLLPGDLVFFNTRGPISHVGIYVGDGKFIHAANRRRGVRVDYLKSPYYSKRYAGARRYLSN